MGNDGAKGLKLLHDSGMDTLVQDPRSALVSEAPAAAIALDPSVAQVPLDDLGERVIGLCNQS
jgi:two-component system chemotaxis response regulator CheB